MTYFQVWKIQLTFFYSILEIVKIFYGLYTKVHSRVDQHLISGL